MFASSEKQYTHVCICISLSIYTQDTAGFASYQLGLFITARNTQIAFCNSCFVYLYLSLWFLYFRINNWKRVQLFKKNLWKWKAIQVVNSRGFVSSVGATMAIEKSSESLPLSWGMNWSVFLCFCYCPVSPSIFVLLHMLSDSIIVLLNTLSDWILCRWLTIVLCLFKNMNLQIGA